MLAESRGTVQWQHVRGHAGNPWNELADRCAATAREFPLEMRHGTARVAGIGDHSEHAIFWALHGMFLDGGARDLPPIGPAGVVVSPSLLAGGPAFESLGVVWTSADGEAGTRTGYDAIVPHTTRS